MTDRPPLHMARIRLNLARLVGLARLRRLPLWQVDLGYIVHMQLRELFGDAAPQPFMVDESAGRWTTVLGYTATEAAELENTARACADPAIFAACDWEHLDSKQMPSTWGPGQSFGFETTVCPIVRMASEAPQHRKGAEVDAFLAECWKTGDCSLPVGREAVYRDWLVKRMETSGARVLAARLHRFRRERLLRRSHNESRTSHLCERPSVAFRGTLQVADPEGFDALLRRGIGRHKAFGFGMILLRRPDSV